MVGVARRIDTKSHRVGRLSNFKVQFSILPREVHMEADARASRSKLVAAEVALQVECWSRRRKDRGGELACHKKVRKRKLFRSRSSYSSSIPFFRAGHQFAAGICYLLTALLRTAWNGTCLAAGQRVPHRTLSQGLPRWATSTTTGDGDGGSGGGGGGGGDDESGKLS